MSVSQDSPAARAEDLLRQVMGEERFQELRSVGYIDIPSRRLRGRVYRLDSLGNLSYRDPGEAAFNTTLCVQPAEPIPRDDQIAMRYLLVTADEERLLKTANPISFGFGSLVTALHHDFAQRYPGWAAGILSALVVAFFLGSLVLEVWAVATLFGSGSTLALGVVLFVLFLLPALVGVVLVMAFLADLARFIQTWTARRRLPE